jgi:hypothetical protein
MKPKSPVAPRALRQFRGNVTTRRKLASMRVLAQRRRLRRQMQPGTDSLAIFADSVAESNPTQRSFR